MPRIIPSLLAFSALLLIAPAASADEPGGFSPVPEGASAQAERKGWELNPEDRFWRVRLVPELGFLGPLSHTIQLSEDGTTFDYIEEGGQDNLFVFARLQAEFEFVKRLNLVLLYQPIDVRTSFVMSNDNRFDGTDFPAGTPVDARYGFSFYRLSIYYDVFKAPDIELGFGISAQIRNATIDFTSADGELRTTNRDIGFVPILKIRGRYTWTSGFFLGAEIDGFYAQGRGVVGRENVEPGFRGLIMDAGIRAGFWLDPVGDLFLSLRYIGGGAEGTSESSPPPSDGYVSNWIHTLNLSLGFMLR